MKCNATIPRRLLINHVGATLHACRIRLGQRNTFCALLLLRTDAVVMLLKLARIADEKCGLRDYKVSDAFGFSQPFTQEVITEPRQIVRCGEIWVQADEKDPEA